MYLLDTIKMESGMCESRDHFNYGHTLCEDYPKEDYQNYCLSYEQNFNAFGTSKGFPSSGEHFGGNIRVSAAVTATVETHFSYPEFPQYESCYVNNLEKKYQGYLGNEAYRFYGCATPSQYSPCSLDGIGVESALDCCGHQTTEEASPGTSALHTTPSQDCTGKVTYKKIDSHSTNFSPSILKDLALNLFFRSVRLCFCLIHTIIIFHAMVSKTCYV